MSGRIARAAAAALLAAALAGCAPGVRDSAGQVTSPATTDSFSVRVGDCLGTLPSESTEALTLLPCAGPHHWEAFGSATLSGEDYPGNNAVRDQARAVCADGFADFVGMPTGKSKLELTMLTPTQETWTEALDREVVCLVGTPGGGITGTLRSAAR